MNLVETPLMHTLSRALDLTSARQSLVSQNVANIDTPGYKTRDIDFRQELQRALADEQLPEVAPVVREVSGLIERPDGNNVSLDEEASNLLLYQRAYQAAAQAISTVDQMLQTAIQIGAGV